MARHQDLTINHRLESWVYANAAARLSASGFLSGDVGRIAYQSDTGQYFRLTAVTPTWALLAGAVIAGGAAGAILGKNSAADYDVGWLATNNNNLVTQANTTISSTSLVMMGFGLTLTPRKSGVIVVALYATVSATAAGNWCQSQFRFGTGTAPGVNTAASGTVIGQPISAMSSAATGYQNACMSMIQSGLTLGTAYWFDIARSVNAGSGTWYNPALFIHEI